MDHKAKALRGFDFTSFSRWNDTETELYRKFLEWNTNDNALSTGYSKIVEKSKAEQYLVKPKMSKNGVIHEKQKLLYK